MRRIWIVLFAALLAIGCGQPDEPATPGESTGTSQTAPAGQFDVGSVAPDIEGIDLAGESFKLSDYRGKVVLLDFWGDW